MKQTIILSLLTASALAGRCAVISYTGNIEGAEVRDWRNPAVPKTMDLDGNNIYGSSLGAVHWVQTSKGEVSPGGGFGWSYRGERTYGQFMGAGYASINNLNGIGDGPAGIAAVQWPGEFYFSLEGAAADYDNKKVRVGVMADVLSQPEWGADNSKTLWLTGPGGADSGVVSLRGGAAGNGVPEMHFFDLTDVNPGDLFTIHANGPGGVQPGYIGPVSWDIVAVPEPASLALSGVVALGALGFAIARRRATGK